MKTILSGVVGIAAVLGALAFFGLTPFGKQVVKDTFGGAAPTNSTASTQKVLQINGWNLGSGTSTSVQNTTGYDLSATMLQYECSGVASSQTAYTGAGLASVTLKAATTSTSHVSDAPTSNTAISNTNTIVSTTLATSSANTLVASTTPAIAGNVALNDIIPAGAYISFFTNATNTAVCNIGVQVN